MINAQGYVVSTDDNYVSVRMTDADLGNVLIEPYKLTKMFQVGDHVKVVNGQHKDARGMVTQVKNNIASIYSDVTKQQFDVFMRDVQKSVDMATATQELIGGSAYKVHDCVQLGMQTVAVIIKVEHGSYGVIDHNGIVKTVGAQEIQQKRETSRQSSTLDAQNNTLNTGSIVQVYGGENAGRQATVLHVYRTWVFLHDKNLAETSGVFVARSRTVGLMGQQNNQQH